MRHASALERQGRGRGRASAARGGAARGAGPLAILYLVSQILLGLGLPAAAAPPLLDRFGNPICSTGSGHDAGGGPGQPHADAARCCAALCFAAATAAPPPATLAAAVPRPACSGDAAPAGFAIIRHPLDDTPRLTRGPPIPLRA